ncbi:MAG TPA: thiolase family protein [Xanthobacteraceae bacterium]|nr:thiolase family protein [Xanthobacteraceae bacterium]
MSARAVILAARRTPVAPRRGALAHIEAFALAAPVLAACLADAGLDGGQVDEVVLGNALAAGGNVARLAALAAGLPERVPAFTLDRQCCSGLDAIILAARMVESGAAQAVLAGGVESWSRAPLRARRPPAGEAPAFYERPPFTPWPERDPDPVAAAADLARARGISRAEQGAFAVASHAKALAGYAEARAGGHPAELVRVPGAALDRDAFARKLTPALCARAPILAGDPAFAVDAATAAVEADGAAAVLVASEAVAARLGVSAPLAIAGGLALGGDPAQPALAPGPVVRTLLARHGLAPHRLERVELMEAFAAQALVNCADTGLDPARINAGGGALARGHPVGASGAILAVRLFHELRTAPAGSFGLAAIAAVGGLATALLLRR